ncbi:MAG: ATP-binding cassette domain-containing protein [Nitrolancea sp.]
MSERDESTSLITMRNFSYRYPAVVEGEPPVTALEGINLDIAAGEFLGVTGTTGSGKSTLCLALNGLVPHATGGIIAGDVVVGGWNTKRVKVPRMATRVGVVFQDPESNLVGLNVEDEVAFGAENLGVPVAEIAERLEWALNVVGMSTERGRSANQLSGGQKQRVAIAAVLAMRPEVLVLDEPTAQLDPRGKIEVASAIETLRHEQGRGVTVVMVEQDAELLAQFADRVVVLDEGKIVAEGTPREVFRRVGELEARGVSVPQIAEVAAQLNRRFDTQFTFMTPDDAAEILMPMLQTSGDD